MIVKALAENTSVSPELGCEHGLSLYIETPKHRILFDSGVGELFAKNARIMGVDLTGVDIAFISHGHYDHGGGLQTFFALNDRAPVHTAARAFEGHFAYEGGVRYIGLDTSLLENDRFVFTGAHMKIDDELETFSNVTCRRLNPTGNADLLMKDGEEIVRDDFAHEQNLIIRAESKTVLITGCSHCGIVNILERFQADNGVWPHIVIGGFHLYNPARDIYEQPEIVRDIGEFLLKTGAKFYTCHCTGIESYNRLKDAMGDWVNYLSGGMTLTV